LRGRTSRGILASINGEPVIYREEVVAMLFGLADLNVKVRRIIHLVEREFDGEEGPEEDDS